MSDNGITNSFEAMKEELDAAGYGIRLQVRASYITLPFDKNVWIGSVTINSLENNTDELIRYAYAHLQREKAYQAMRELLEEMVGDFKPLPEYQDSLSYWRNKAGRLLESMKG
jgi:hypothetical protein